VAPGDALRAALAATRLRLDKEDRMTWFLVAAVALVFAVGLARRRGRPRARARAIRVSRPEASSTLRVGISGKQSKATRAALDAASSTLR
jgi:hypothetical protein